MSLWSSIFSASASAKTQTKYKKCVIFSASTFIPGFFKKEIFTAKTLKSDFKFWLKWLNLSKMKGEKA